MKHFIMAILAIVADSFAADYCDKGLCPANVPHIGCQNPEFYISNCPAGNAGILDSQDLKDHIVVVHNTYRNYAASGFFELSPACRMAVMQWDEELELLAKLNLQTCKSEHDLCRNTLVYPNAGQNVGHRVANANTNSTIVTNGIIVEWFGEGAKATKEMVANFSPSSHKPDSEFPNFATMVMDKNNRIGCALSAVPIDDTEINYLLTCNYAHAPLNCTEIYSSCEKAGEKCVTSANQDFPNLCSENEVYD